MGIRAAAAARWNAPQGYAAILRVGLPLVASMGASTVMQFTDRLFLSHYSIDAIAAALPASMACLTISMTLMGVCGYSSVLIAQYTGAGRPQRVGRALWQGIWAALAGAIILLAIAHFAAVPLFRQVGHTEAVQRLEVQYFRIFTSGSGFGLLNSAMAGFFSGRGQTRPVLIANTTAALVNIPLGYLLIFGGFGIPPLGIVGAGCATVTGWALCSCMLARLIFTRKHERLYAVRSSWGCRWEMLRRMLRFGLPSGVNFFMEMSVITWFVFELGKLGEAVQAASNIAFSVNSVQFLPMLGLNIAVSSLVGQSMGRRQPKEAERITVNSLHLSLAYMLPCCLILALFPGPIMDLFAPGNMSPEYFRPIRDMGGMILRFIALYSLVDSGNIIFFGALKGAGDTLGVMLLYVCGGLFLLVAPILILKRLDLVSVEHYWMAFSAYVVVLAICAALRFFRRGWHTIRVIEQHAEE